MIIYHRVARSHLFLIAIVLGLVTFSAVISAVIAQPLQKKRLTMRAAVEEALVHNPQLVAFRYEPFASRADELTAHLRPNPSATISADIIPSDGLPASEKNFGVSFGVPIELGGKRDARIRNAEANTRLAEIQYEDAVRQTVLNVRSSYIDFASAQATAEASRENLGLLDSLVSLSQIRVAGRDIAQVELTRSEVEREKFSLEVARAVKETAVARTALYALLGRTVQTGLTLDQVPDTLTLSTMQDLSRKPLPNVDTLIAIAKAERPDLQALKQSENVAQTNLDLQHSLATIDLNVSLDILRSQGVGYYGTTVSVPLPFFNRNQGEIEKANIRLEQTRSLTTAALLQVEADVRSAYFDAQNKQRTVNRLRDTILAKARSVRDAQEYSYRRGGTSLIDFLDAVRTYNELRQSYVQSLSDYAKSLVTLNALISRDIFNEMD